jgi:hypothetical protein
MLASSLGLTFASRVWLAEMANGVFYFLLCPSVWSTTEPRKQNIRLIFQFFKLSAIANTVNTNLPCLRWLLTFRRNLCFHLQGLQEDGGIGNNLEDDDPSIIFISLQEHVTHFTVLAYVNSNNGLPIAANHTVPYITSAYACLWLLPRPRYEGGGDGRAFLASHVVQEVLI